MRSAAVFEDRDARHGRGEEQNSIQKKPIQSACTITKSSAIGQMISNARSSTNMGRYRLRTQAIRLQPAVGRFPSPRPETRPTAEAARAGGRNPDPTRIRIMAEDHATMPTEEEVFGSARGSDRPRTLDLVSLGLVHDVALEAPDVYVISPLTTPARPIGPQVSEQMKELSAGSRAYATFIRR